MGPNIVANPVMESDAVATKRAHVEPGITSHVMKLYQTKSVQTKEKIDQNAAEIMQRQEKMKLLNEVLSEINNLTNNLNELSIKDHPEIQEKIDVLRELGVKITDGQLEFNSFQLIRLKENMQLQGDNWHKENQSQSQKLERLSQFLNQLVMLMKDAQRCDKNSFQKIINGLR